MRFDKQVFRWVEHSGASHSTTSKRRKRGIVVILLCISAIAICSIWYYQSKPAVTPLRGYLPADSFSNGLVLIPPPARGSAALTLDENLAKKCVALRDTSRWRLAASDADLTFPHAASTFSCALGIPITEENTPHLFILLRRTLYDASLSTSIAKNHFNRDRPFEINKEPICTPDRKKKLAKNGSYPSGHTAIGWAWALMLSEIAPEQTDALLERGRTFGESRMVCNVHWYSDIIQGYLMGADTVKRLRGDPVFLADFEAAKAELTVVRSKGLKSSVECKEESPENFLQSSLVP